MSNEIEYNETIKIDLDIDKITTQDLHDMISRLDINVFKQLLDKGMDPNIIVDNDSTVMNYLTAIRHANQESEIKIYEIIKLFIEYGGDINKKNQHTDDAIIYAFAENHILVCDYIIDKIENINYQNENGMSYLMAATYGDNFQGVLLLLENNCDPTLTTKKGETFIDMYMKPEYEIIKYLSREKVQYDLISKHGMLYKSFKNKNLIHPNNVSKFQHLDHALNLGVL